MNPIRLPLWLAAPLALAACGEAPAPEPTPSATPTVAAPRTLVAADFDPESLGTFTDFAQNEFVGIDSTLPENKQWVNFDVPVDAVWIVGRGGRNQYFEPPGT